MMFLPFADDNSFVISHECPLVQQNLCDETLKILFEGCSYSELYLNTKKFQALLFQTSQRNIINLKSLKINNSNIIINKSALVYNWNFPQYLSTCFWIFEIYRTVSHNYRLPNCKNWSYAVVGVAKRIQKSSPILRNSRSIATVLRQWPGSLDDEMLIHNS